MRVDAVHQARVRWVDAVAEHAADPAAELPGDVAARGEGEGLTGAEPGFAVVGGDGQVGRAARVRGAGVPEGALRRRVQEPTGGSGGPGWGEAAAGQRWGSARPRVRVVPGSRVHSAATESAGRGRDSGIVLVVGARRAGRAPGADLDDFQLGEQEVGQQQPVERGRARGGRSMRASWRGCCAARRRPAGVAGRKGSRPAGPSSGVSSVRMRRQRRRSERGRAPDG